MHVRGQIRNFVMEKIGEIPELQNRVISDEFQVTARVELPICAITIGDESVQPQSLGDIRKGRKLRREAELFVDVITQAAAGATAAAEELAAQIEAKVCGDPRFANLVQDCSLRAYSITENEEGGGHIVRLRLQFAVTYSTHERDATVAS